MYRARWEIIKQRIDDLPPPRPEPPEPRPSAKRVALCKRRKKQGLHLVSILLGEDALDALVQLAFLDRDQRASRPAIRSALTRYLVANLIEKYQYTPWAKAGREQRTAAMDKRTPSHETGAEKAALKAPFSPL